MRFKPLILALFIALLTAPVRAGAPEDAVLSIGTFDELAAFSERVARGELAGVRAQLTADIRATRPLRAIGTALHMFSGEFDGQGHVISNLLVFAPRGSQGLFGSVAPEGVIRNLALEHACVIGAGYVGVLAGYCAGRIEGCRVENSRAICLSRALYGTAAGGIAGLASGRIASSAALMSSVRAPANAGGLCGAYHAGVLARCAFSGVVAATGAGEAPCGGLVGSLHGGARLRFCAGFGAVMAFSGDYADTVAGGVFSGSSAVGCLFAGPGASPALRRLVDALAARGV